MKKSLKLKWKLSLSYVLVALLLVGGVSLFSNFLLQHQFEQYIIQKQNEKNREIVNQVSQQYDPSTGSFPASSLESIGVAALERGMIIRVSDGSGRVLWDAMVHNNGLCHRMLQSMADDMKKRYPDFQGAYEEKNYPVLSGSRTAGSVSVGYYGPFYLSDNDTAFIGTLNRGLAGVGLISLFAAALVGLLMARRISRPIEQAIGMTERIALGDYPEKAPARSGTLELDRLAEAVEELSRKLERQDLLRRRMTADVAHELRTPLTVLRGNIEALLDGVWQADEQHLSGLHDEILRLTRLVADLDKLARLEDESTPLEKSPVDLAALASGTVLSFEPKVLEKGVSIRVSGTAPPIEADGDKLRQVLINLLSNSLKSTGRGGGIRILLSREGRFAKIEVEDTGTGISPEDLPYVFERFYRADPSRSSQSGGAGIGLSVVRAIVEKHGGTVTAQSEPGHGSRFTVLLPYGPDAALPDEMEEHPPE
jgi:signal transduction histidine kinase